MQELVQVESLAQVGVQLLLFTLGLEFRWVLCLLASTCGLSRLRLPGRLKSANDPAPTRLSPTRLSTLHSMS